MSNVFLNLPVPVVAGPGVAVDVSAMGKSKSIVVGGPISGTLNVEYSNDNVNFAQLQSFQSPGNLMIDVACKWMRVSVSGASGSGNVDVGSSDAGAQFVQLPSGGAPADISVLPLFKTVVVNKGFVGNIEISEDGVSWAQIFSFATGGSSGQSGSFYGAFARIGGGAAGTVWMAGAEGDDEDSGVPTPPFEVVTRTVYARITGSDMTGTGTLLNPYRTFQRAIRDVPHFITGGNVWNVDYTGIGVENFPAGYQMPAITSGKPMVSFDNTAALPFQFITPLNLFAKPMPAAILTVPEATIVGGDIASIAKDPITNLIVITLNAPRGGAWAVVDSLKGYLLCSDALIAAGCAIYGNDATHLYLCNAADIVTVFTTGTIGTLTVSEQSATFMMAGFGAGDDFTVTGAFNMFGTNCVAVQGTKFRVLGQPLVPVDPNPCSVAQGNAEFPFWEMCDINGFSSAGADTGLTLQSCALRGRGLFMVPSAPFVTNSLMLDVQVIDFVGEVGSFIANSVMDGCSSCGPGPAIFTPGGRLVNGFWEISNVLCKGSKGNAATLGAFNVFGPVFWSFANVDILNCLGPAIVANKGSQSVLVNVKGSGNVDTGVVADGGAMVQVDANTTVTGTLHDFKCGALAATAPAGVGWAALTNVAGGYDAFGVGAGAAALTVTGSRIYK